MAKSGGRKFSIGVDYGTNSVRALVVDTADGEEIATHVYNYPSGEAGILLDPKDPNLARQNPADYIEGFYTSVRRAVAAAKRQAAVSSRRTWSASASTRPARRRSRSTATARRWRCSRSSRRTWPPRPGCGRTTPATPRRRRSPPRPRQDPRPLSGQVRRHLFLRMVLVEDPALQADRAPRCSTRPTAGSNWPTSCPRSHRQHRPAHDEARHLRRRTQGDVQRRMGRPARAQSSWRRSIPELVAAPRALRDAGRAGRPAGRRT